MVRYCVFLIAIICCLLCGCRILLVTPFPDELTYLDATVDLSKVITSTENTLGFRMVSFDDYLCIVMNQQDTQWAYLINANTPEDVTPMEGSFNNLFMVAANGNLIIGNYELDSDLSSSIPFTTISNTHFGFAHEGLNYHFWFEKHEPFNTLCIRLEDADWSGPVKDYIVDIDRRYELVKVLFDRTGSSLELAYAVCIFRIESSRFEAVRIPLSYLDDSSGTALVEDLGYPFGLSKIYIPHVDKNDFFYTRRGIVVREWDRYYLYGFDEQVFEMRSSRNERDKILAFDVRGNYYYKFDSGSERLTKYAVWW